MSYMTLKNRNHTLVSETKRDLEKANNDPTSEFYLMQVITSFFPPFCEACIREVFMFIAF